MLALVCGSVYLATGRVGTTLLTGVALMVFDLNRRMWRVEAIAEDLDALVLEREREEAAAKREIEK